MLHELRIYETMPGKLGDLNNRFANHTTGFFNKHGIGMLGFWTDMIGTGSQLTYILTSTAWPTGRRSGALSRRTRAGRR